MQSYRFVQENVESRGKNFEIIKRFAFKSLLFNDFEKNVMSIKKMHGEEKEMKICLS